LEPDPEQRKINALRVVLQKERELAQAEIATLEKKFAKSDFFYSKGALESKASVSDFFYRELGEPVEKSKPNHAKMQPQPNFLSVSELEKGLLPGQKPEPPPAPAKKRQPPQPTTKKEDGPLEPEELAKLEAAAIKAAQVEQSKENCNRSRQRVAMLGMGGRVAFVDEKGDRVFLTDIQLEAELEKARIDVRQWCSES
jgi:hypothetical protein